MPTTVTPMFGAENYHVVDGIANQNPHTVNGKQVEVVYDDGRHFYAPHARNSTSLPPTRSTRGSRGALR